MAFIKVKDKKGKEDARVHDEQGQRSGIDVEFTGADGRVYYVDEKAQLHYLNQNLPTFAFELLSFQKGYWYPYTRILNGTRGSVTDFRPLDEYAAYSFL